MSFVAFTKDQFEALDAKLTEISQGGGGGGGIADGSVTTAKLADEAVTMGKIDPDVISTINTYADNGDEAALVACDVATQTVLASLGITVDVVAPDDLDPESLDLVSLAKPALRLCWMSGTDLEVAVVRIVGDTTGGTVTMEAEGGTSTVSGVLGVDSAWTVTPSGSGGGSTNPQYGTSSTANNTAAKVVTCEGFTLETGARIAVKFANESTTTNKVKLNVNGTGDVEVYVNGAAQSSTNSNLKWGAGAVLTFVYDGTYWQLEDKAGSIFATSSTAASDDTKIVSAIGSNTAVPIINGTILVVNFANANTVANLTKLNVFSTGISYIYRNNAQTSTTNTLLWGAGSTLAFVKRGAQWEYIGGDLVATS